MSVAAADVDFPLVGHHRTTETGLKHRGNLRPFVLIRLIPEIANSLSSHLKVSSAVEGAQARFLLSKLNYYPF